MVGLQALAPDFDVLNFAECQQRHCMPAYNARGEKVWVVADVSHPDLMDWALENLGVSWVRVMHTALPEDFTAALARHENELSALDSISVEYALDSNENSKTLELSLASIAQHASPVVKLVDSTLYDALQEGASDIHLESDATGMTIKYRIDGVLAVFGRVEGASTAEQIVSRIKVLAELDIAERRTPQDGRFKIKSRGRDVDLRVSIMPSVEGEDAVLRLLDRRALAKEMSAGLSLEGLGLDNETLVSMRQLCRAPHGMILVTGPTGSGKTTTLYAAITETQHVRDKIITIEDPVEYKLPGVLQIPVNEKKGLTFARGLRSILRHDPDKIMVGEIRDAETAQIAVQSALTGHLVFTTVHANNVFDVLGRFLHMGLDAYSFVSALNGIVAQRLLRVLCQHCAQPVHEEAKTKKAVGCSHCRGTGYKGRVAIGEVLILDDELRDLIIRRESMPVIKRAAAQKGTRLLRERALELVAKGQTTQEEADRVTFSV
jgi:general secretion pathway protein E